MNTIFLNRRLFLKLLALVPALKKLLEPAPEVVQAMPAPHNRRNDCKCAHCEFIRRKYGPVGVFIGTPRGVIKR